jgi:hypothetical protein
MSNSLPLAGSHYGYSGTRIEALGATEYTLIGIAADQSGSVHPFRTEIEDCLKAIVRSCGASARADNLMLRCTTFDQRIHEVHGFRPLANCPADDYVGAVDAGGTTALYDAAHNAVAAVVNYGETLTAKDFEVNGVIFVITDGYDNASTLTSKDVAAAVSEAVQSESLQSVLTVLVGVNVSNAACSRELMAFSANAGFDQYIEIAKADAKTLARLAVFASRSISQASTALGGGTPIRSLSF